MTLAAVRMPPVGILSSAETVEAGKRNETCNEA
jgi:hypothetical protein